MLFCLICGKNPDNYKTDRAFICSNCTQERVNFIRMLERETKIDIKNSDYFGLAYNIWKSKQKSKELHKRLKKIRKEKGWSLRRLAAHLELDHNYLARMENGIKPLNKKTLRFIEKNINAKTNT